MRSACHARRDRGAARRRTDRRPRGRASTRSGRSSRRRPSTISFLANPALREAARGHRAPAASSSRRRSRAAASARGAAIVTPDPYLYFARLTQWWAARTRPAPAPGVHPSAAVDPAAEIARRCVDRRLRRDRGRARRSAPASSIGAHAFVGRDCRVGAGTRLAPRVDPDVRDCRSASAASSSRAPSSAPTASASRPPAAAGRRSSSSAGVRIGDDVEIGANTCIDRGAARRHGDRRRRQDRQPGADRPQRAHRRAHRDRRLRRHRRQRHDRRATA